MNHSVEKIKQSVTVSDCCQTYGISLDRKGYACCPFHSEKTASFGVFDDGKRFYCFGCGAGGDVISFVQQLFHINFMQAIARLDCDFHLGLNSGIPNSKAIEERRRELKAKAEKEHIRKHTETALIEEIKKLCEVHRLYRKVLQERPTEPDGLYFDALKNIDYVKYRIEVDEEILWQMKTQR